MFPKRTDPVWLSPKPRKQGFKAYIRRRLTRFPHDEVWLFCVWALSQWNWPERGRIKKTYYKVVRRAPSDIRDGFHKAWKDYERCLREIGGKTIAVHPYTKERIRICDSKSTERP